MEEIYFNEIPSKLIEIILSYVESLDLDNLVKLLHIKINWSTVHLYHFGDYKQIDSSDYIRKLGVSEFKNILKLGQTVNYLMGAKFLYLFHLNIKEIPRQIGYLIDLEELHLNDNLIKEIPSEISNLSKLQILNLSDNEIEEIPCHIENLYDLCELSLVGNYVSEIPSCLDYMRDKIHLKELSVESSSDSENS